MFLLRSLAALLLGLTAACENPPQALVSSTPTTTAKSTEPATVTPVESLTPTQVTATPSPMLATAAKLGSPTSLVFDSDGNLYVSECTGTFGAKNHILKIDPVGMLTIFAGQGPADFSGDGGAALSAFLYCPWGLAFAPDGSLYMADHGANRVRRIDVDGIITTVVGSGPIGIDAGSFSGDGGPATQATLQEPTEIAFDVEGNLYISDRDNDRIRKVDTNGIITTVAGNGESGLSADGGQATAGPIDDPAGLAFDSEGRLFFSDSNNFRIRRIDKNGILTTVAGNGDSKFSGDGGQATAAGIVPGNLAFDSEGNLYIVDGNRIRMIDKNGIITTVAGNATTGSLDDGGPAIDATLFSPIALAFDAEGNLYITEDATSRVRKIDQNGIITTVVGGG